MEFEEPVVDKPERASSFPRTQISRRNNNGRSPKPKPSPINLFEKERDPSLLAPIAHRPSCSTPVSSSPPSPYDNPMRPDTPSRGGGTHSFRFSGMAIAQGDLDLKTATASIHLPPIGLNSKSPRSAGGPSKDNWSEKIEIDLVASRPRGSRIGFHSPVENTSGTASVFGESDPRSRSGSVPKSPRFAEEFNANSTTTRPSLFTRNVGAM